ncbi:hypothetical protein GTO10_02360 [Candidatus Saccharibacteria bacterium]|nr:hypothetical protein [Candidatus Saccharibacteria bacterium]
MGINFPSYHPYAISLPELWVRYIFAAAVYVLLGIASWLLLHRFIFNRDWKAFVLSLITSSSMILWPLAILPYLRFFKFEAFILTAASAVVLMVVVDRFLWKGEGKIKLKEKNLAKRALVLVALTAFVGVSIFSYVEYSYDDVTHQKSLARLDKAAAELASYQEIASQTARSLIEDQSFVETFKQKEFSTLTSQTREILNETPELNALAITDESGIVVVAPHNPLLIGTDLGMLGPTHTKILQGEAQRFLEPAVSAPLVVGAGEPLKEREQVIGAVFAARLVNRELALDLAEKTGVLDLGIYCNCNKLYVSTIEDETLDKAMQNFIQLAFTDPNVSQNTSFTQNISSGGQTYTASGKILTNGEGESTGLLVVFEPYPSKDLSAFLTAITFLATAVGIGLFVSPLVVHRIVR